jgi:hypothetical protein
MALGHDHRQQCLLQVDAAPLLVPDFYCLFIVKSMGIPSLNLLWFERSMRLCGFCGSESHVFLWRADDCSEPPVDSQFLFEYRPENKAAKGHFMSGSSWASAQLSHSHGIQRGGAAGSSFPWEWRSDSWQKDNEGSRSSLFDPSRFRFSPSVRWSPHKKSLWFLGTPASSLKKLLDGTFSHWPVQFAHQPAIHALNWKRSRWPDHLTGFVHDVAGHQQHILHHESVGDMARRTDIQVLFGRMIRPKSRSRRTGLRLSC